MLRFTATHEVWLAGEKFAGGEHEVTDPSDELRKHVAAAEAVGAVVDAEGHDESHVQSQEDAEAALAKAMGTWNHEEQRWSGPWHEGNVLSQEEMKAAIEAQGGLGAVAISVDVDPE